MKEINFSLWCDFLESDFINLEFTELIQNGTINGATSNPSIFKNAICNSIAYNELKDKFRKKDGSLLTKEDEETIKRLTEALKKYNKDNSTSVLINTNI